MKTINVPLKKVKLLISMVIAGSLIFSFFLTSCGNKEKTVVEQSEIASPPPLPPDKPAFPESNVNGTNGIYIIVDTMPVFPGGQSAMMGFINEKIVYPEIAMSNGIQGIVFLRFCITSQGKVDQISVLKGANPALDTEAMRTVSLMPDWTPGRLHGKNVSVWYQLPIQFQLK